MSKDCIETNCEQNGALEVLKNATKWQDVYLLKLAVYDHLVECKSLYEAYKLSAINPHFTVEELEHELFKELMDLYILLELLFSQDTITYRTKELRNLRLTKFISKLE